MLKMKQLKQNLKWLLLSIMLFAGASSAGAETSTLTFTAKCNGSGVADDNVAWTITSDGTESIFDANKGIHYGTSSAAVTYINLTTSGISGSITKIIVNASTANGVTATVGVTVGGSTFGGNPQSLSTSAADYTFEGNASGSIVVYVSKPSSAAKALYVKSIQVVYDTGGTAKANSEVTFPQSSYSATYPGTFTAPTATVANASTHTTVSDAEVSYSSDNTSVAEVNSSTGAVTLTGIGTATITAAFTGNDLYNGSSGSYTLTVSDSRTATTLSFPSDSYEAIIGESFSSPAATLKNASTNEVVSGATFSYTSSDPSVATVDGNTGEVSIEGEGRTIITASFAGDGTYQGSSATYTLTVSNPDDGNSFTWDLTTNSYSSASQSQVVWNSDYATMTLDKSSSSTNANNYLGGDSNNRTSSRFYKNQQLTISPVTGYKLKSIEFKATSTNYANALDASKWANATSSVSETLVTITPTAGTSDVTVTIGNTCGFNGVTVYYELSSSITPDAPTLTPSCTFWPKTTETASMTVTISPTSTGSTVRYTTDGSDPTTTNGHIVTSSTDITVIGTTTVKAIAYIGTSASGIASATYTEGQTVNSIAAFKALPEGTEARLYLSPDNNARVLHAFESEIYVRDNSGAICFYLASSLQNPVPEHDWHVAGWIIGKYQPFNNLPEFVATSNTTMDYLAIASPITEEATEPIAISANDFDSYKADWVKISDLRAECENNVSDDAGNTFKVYNKYNLTSSSYYQDLYDYALVDLTGLAVPYNNDREIVPIYYNNKRPIVYVIDENKNFTSPGSDIQNVTVRLVRTLSNTNWNTFCIPFDLPDFDGIIRKYEHAEGQTLVFVDDYIEAGKPYLVKPNEQIDNPIFENVRLSATPSQNIEEGDYTFAGIYSPTDIYTEDKSKLFLKTDGNLYYPTTESAGILKGMRAYFVVPAGSEGVKVKSDDDMSTMIEGIPSDIVPNEADVYSISGQLVGRSLEGLQRGIYIVNGKKVLIK